MVDGSRHWGSLICLEMWPRVPSVSSCPFQSLLPLLSMDILSNTMFLFPTGVNLAAKMRKKVPRSLSGSRTVVNEVRVTPGLLGSNCICIKPHQSVWSGGAGLHNPGRTSESLGRGVWILKLQIPKPHGRPNKVNVQVGPGHGSVRSSRLL